MTYSKLQNGSPSRFGLIVSVDVANDTVIYGTFRRALEEWVWDSLDRAHRCLDHDITWYFVGNVNSDQGLSANRYQVCVRIEPHDDTGEQSGLFHYMPIPYKTEPVHPANVLEHFTSPPENVRGVSVSGVHQTVLRDQWAACITKLEDDSSFDIPGEGYMKHPMWTLASRGWEAGHPRLAIRREVSYLFNWPDYPGRRGDDW